jgi:S1-C subfamily serine protease
MKPDTEPLVSIKTHVPEDAMSAGLLGTVRNGHGVRIRDDGLIATIGYVIHEADDVWLTSSEGITAPGFVVGYDFDSGFGLVKSTMPFDGPAMPLGTAADLAVDDAVYVAASGDAGTINAKVVAKQEFAGRWEYLLDEAIFTAPHHDSWSGAALVDERGRLCGLGSLVIQGFAIRGLTTTVNMFVPIDLLKPIVNEMCEHGRRLGPPRPWLGVLVHDELDQLTVVGVYRNCPADRAGLKPGDIILRIDDEPVESLAKMFRRIWSLGSAGVEIPMSIMRDSERLDKVVHSADRFEFQRVGTIQ